MRKIIIVAMLLIVTSIKAQQDASFTTYNYNLNSINPAFSLGNGGSVRSGFINRTQWLGFEDAPNTSELFLHYAFSDETAGAITIQHDRLGKLLSETTIAVDYSYNLFINPYSYFSLGLKVSATMFNSNLKGLMLESGNYTTDPSFLDNPKKFFPNVGAGVFWYDEDFGYYVGLSVPNLFNEKYFNTDGDTYKYKLENQHVYLTGGTIFELVNDMIYRPSVLVRYTAGNPLTLDINNKVQVHDKFELGISYSLGVSVSALASMKFGDNWKLGYSFGMPTNKLFGEQLGSHELFLLYDMNFKGTRYRSTRSF